MQTQPERQALEQARTEPQPVVETPQEPAQEDILTRVSKWQAENKTPEESKVPEDFHFDVNEINAIEDPVARETAQRAYKSFQKGFDKKFTEIAEMRKAMETQQQPQEWTVERMQNELKNPRFIEIAQQVAGQQPDDGTDEYSSLSDSERARIANLESAQAKIEQREMELYNRQQHESLKAKYADYKPEAIDTIKADMIANKVQATNEHIYWAFNGPDKVKEAYQMGLRDAGVENVEKFQNSSIEASTTVPSHEGFKKGEGESSKDMWRRIKTKVLNDISNNTTIRR